MTLFEKLGGEAAVDLAVDRFYDRVLQDDRINHFFASVDMVKQMRLPPVGSANEN